MSEILETGAYVLGKHNRALEEEIAARHGVRHGIAVNSGTDALRIMLDATGIGPGDEVITTAFTFVSSLEVILQAGAKPVLVDIEPEGFMLDPRLVEGAVTERTRAIMPVHLFGQLADVESLGNIAESHGLLVLEDAAQAIDSNHNGIFAGNFGAAAGLSFYVTKNLGAAGDAGMILTNDDEIAEKARSMRVHGMGRERYYYDYVGYTSRMDELQAAVLRAKLGRLSEWNQRRQHLAALYNEELAGTPVRTPAVLPGNNHTWHQYSIVAPRRDELQAFLKEQGVDSMVYYPVPLHFHQPYRHLANGRGSLPVTEEIASSILSLPVHPHLSDEQVRYAAAKVREFYGA